MTHKWVYLFTEGNAQMRNLLGGKGSGVAEMTRAGLPVPPGFTITTEACNEYNRLGGKFPDGMWEQVLTALEDVEQKTGKGFGKADNPLLVSVRSGARFSMPGMMDTVLNLGLNEQTRAGIVRLTGNERFAYDSFRRFIQMFSKIVLDVEASRFEHILEQRKEQAGAKLDTDLTAEDMGVVAAGYQELVRQATGRDFPTDPLEQLKLAIQAVFHSWNNERARVYREREKIPHDLGTAVNVQMMVFGNMGEDSGTGVAFTRDPNTGEARLFGEYLLNAQGEDVVAGIRTPQPIAVMERDLPTVYHQFLEYAQMLEKHYRDMQDLEFTVERGKLYMLQTRSGKRTAQAAVKIAIDMANDGLIDRQEAIRRVEPAHVEQLLHPRFDEAAKSQAIAGGRLLAKGLDASPGAAIGKIVFDAERAVEENAAGERVILVRPETNPDDVAGMIAAQGILTARGGATSHAAVVARSIGKPCVTGCEALRVDVEAKRLTVDGRTYGEGELLSIDGGTGEVIAGELPVVAAQLTSELRTLLSWADDVRRLEVWANADYPRDADKAYENGAQGIGLCRTEHMFFEEERLPVVRRMILAETEAERRAALDLLLPIQKEDFKGIFRAMRGYPVVIRLLDPPLHEFLPSHEELLVEVTELRAKGGDADTLAEREKVLKRVEQLAEANPMLGLRGCRLGLTFPEINEMQVRAILTAAIEVQAEGVAVQPEIMIPLVGHVNELARVREQLEVVARSVEGESGGSVPYKFGTMIEVPRAALTADEIAEHAEFFSFGTNDLTQTTFAISRDDAEGKFLLNYVQQKILPTNPFQQIDRAGVGKLMRMAVELGRQARPDIELGICGEHGGDPSSIEFCEQLGLNYVSCSPFRVPVARLAAAQAVLVKGEKDK